MQRLSEENKHKLKEKLGVESFRDYLKELLIREDFINLHKTLNIIEELLKEQPAKVWGDDFDEFDDFE